MNEMLEGICSRHESGLNEIDEKDARTKTMMIQEFQHFVAFRVI
jgi:hypothetical protein